jgi:hypothetical protein
MTDNSTVAVCRLRGLQFQKRAVYNFFLASKQNYISFPESATPAYGGAERSGGVLRGASSS